MRLKLDENLPEALAEFLAQLGHDTDTVPQESLAGRDDSTIWQAAQEAGRFLITQDLDFSDVRRYAPGTHHGLLLVRLRKPGRIKLRQRVSLLFQLRERRIVGRLLRRGHGPQDPRACPEAYSRGIGGLAMHSTAQALLQASVLAMNLKASPAEVRREVFLRFYGAEFGPETKNKILGILTNE